MIRSPLWVTLLCSVVAICLTATGCSQDNTTVNPLAATVGIDLKPDTTGNGEAPGALAAATTLPTLDRRLLSATSLAARIEYTSTSGITDGRTQVTATVFVPRGAPPQGGWPIVVYGHATTGIQSECAPSLSPTLLGASTAIAALVKAGYLVVLPDYQGLGLDHARSTPTWTPPPSATTSSIRCARPAGSFPMPRIGGWRPGSRKAVRPHGPPMNLRAATGRACRWSARSACPRQPTSPDSRSWRRQAP